MSIDDDIKEAFIRHERDVLPKPGAWTEVERRIGRSHRRRLLTTGIGAVLAITAGVLAIPQLGSRDVNPPVATNPPTNRVTTPKVIGTISVPAYKISAGAGSLWGFVAPPKEGLPTQLVRIDPATKRVVARINVGYTPQSLVASDEAIWVTNSSGCMEVVSCGDASPSPEFKFPEQNSVMRIDPRTNTVAASIRLAEPQDVGIGFDSVWVTASDAAGNEILAKIDPATNTIVRQNGISGSGALTIGGGFVPLTIGERYVSVFLPLDGGRYSVYRINPADSAIVDSEGPTFAEVAGVFSIASGFGSTWVSTTGMDSASGLGRVDEQTARVLARITLPDASPVGLDAVASGAGYVWATSGRGYLWKVDPTTNKPASDPVLIGDSPPVAATDVLVAFGSVWVASGDGNIYRLTP